MKQLKQFKGLGILLAIISSGTFGFIPLFSIPLLRGGIELDSVCFYRFLFSSVMMGLYMLFKKVSFSITKKEFITVFLLSVFYASTSIFLTASYAYMPSGISTTIHFLYPVLVATMMILFFKEKLSVKKGVAIMVAIAGVFFLCGGFSAATPTQSINLTGLGLVLITVVTYSTYIVGVNNTPLLMKMNGTKMTFYVLASSAFFFLCNIVIKGGHFCPLETTSQWANALSLAFLATLISDLTLIYAIQMIGSTTTAILGCMEPLTAVTMGFIFFGERLSISQGGGIMMVFVAVYLVILSQKKRNL